MLYFIITACVYNDCQTRKTQYINGIAKLKQLIIDSGMENYKLVIVENNGKRPTFLDILDCEVYYTENNKLPTKNKGYKELQDVFDCIHHYTIRDDDFIVKMTGRYVLQDNSPFMNIIQNIHNTKYDCVIKYGVYNNPVPYKVDDCATGLIGMTCRYVKHIKYPINNNNVEWNWAKATRYIPDSKICILNRLGINMFPGDDIHHISQSIAI